MKNIWTNGCFDIIHVGHIALFEYAKSLGDKLYVGLDSDHRVSTMKGSNRPINNQNDRAKLLHSIKYIDSVLVFDSNYELEEHIKKLHIDTIVVGDDYKDKLVIGSQYVNNVLFFSKISNKSSSIILDKLL